MELSRIQKFIRAASLVFLQKWFLSDSYCLLINLNYREAKELDRR